MTDVIERFHYDESDDTAHISQTQDIEPFLIANKQQRDSSDGRYKHEIMNHTARIPEVVALKWCNDKGIKYQEFLSNPEILKRFLNDPDMAFCRTMKGRI